MTYLWTETKLLFHHEFRITDHAAWSDLSFKQTTALLEALTSEREVVVGFESLAPNPVVPTPIENMVTQGGQCVKKIRI
jgi:hypothetical protein